MPTPATSAQSNCTEAARAAALATRPQPRSPHTAASLAAAARSREAARQALARAATQSGGDESESDVATIVSVKIDATKRRRVG